MEQKQPCVFAFYKNDELIGFRQCTFNSIGMDWAKKYSYSEEQVKIVQRAIQSGIDVVPTKFVDFIKEYGDKKVACQIGNDLRNKHRKLIELCPFEVRVLPYDIDDLETWMLTINNLEPLAVLQFAGPTATLN